MWLILSVWIHVHVFNFFFSRVFCFLRQLSLFMHYSSTVHGTYNHFIQKKILKMGPRVLFTHLKIILLQYFQFSVSAKISYINRILSFGLLEKISFIYQIGLSEKDKEVSFIKL